MLEGRGSGTTVSTARATDMIAALGSTMLERAAASVTELKTGGSGARTWAGAMSGRSAR
jgi:hypothetical protein